MHVSNPHSDYKQIYVCITAYVIKSYFVFEGAGRKSVFTAVI